MPAREQGSLGKFAAQLTYLADEMRECALVKPIRNSCSATAHQSADLGKVAQALLDQLHARKRFLSPSLFHEPAWEILLSTFVADRQRTVLNVKQLVSLIDAPPTTSQRWIDQLVHMKLLQREVDPLDRRRLEISMSSTGAKSVIDYLTWLTASGEILIGELPGEQTSSA